MQTSARTTGFARNDNIQNRFLGYRPLVLLAEDDDDFRALVADSLERDGCNVWGVSTGAELLSALEDVRHDSERPALIITDHHMPRATGLSVLRLVRQWGWCVPAMLVTAFGSEELGIDSKDARVTMVRKPVDIRELRALVRRVLKDCSGELLACAACGGVDDPRPLTDEVEVLFCSDCRTMVEDFDPDDPFWDLGGDG